MPVLMPHVGERAHGGDQFQSGYQALVPLAGVRLKAIGSAAARHPSWRHQPSGICGNQRNEAAAAPSRRRPGAAVQRAQLILRGAVGQVGLRSVA